jgi:hypothetical protein
LLGDNSYGAGILLVEGFVASHVLNSSSANQDITYIDGIADYYTWLILWKENMLKYNVADSQTSFTDAFVEMGFTHAMGSMKDGSQT